MAEARFTEPLRLLNVVGLHPLNDTFISSTRKCITVIIISVTFALTVLEVLFNFNNADTITKAAEIIFPQYQMIWKIAVSIRYKRRLAQLIQNTNKFWPWNQFGNSLQKNIHKNHKLLKTSFLIYKILVFSSMFQFVFAAIVGDKPILICYGETHGLSLFAKRFYFILHVIFLVAVFYTAIGFDGFFFYLIGHILSELKMISAGFSNLKNNKLRSDQEAFMASLQHHMTILSYIKEMNDVYSLLLLNQHMTCLFAICFGLFQMTGDGMPLDYHRLFKHLPFVISFICQLWMFCFAGTLIITWSLKIPDKVFYQDWSDKNTYKNKIVKIMVIKRGQRPAKLTLGGFGNLDLKSFGMVIKNAFSFLTFMQTLTK